MAEVPEHLLKRSQERRKALGLPVEGDDGGDEPPRRDEAPARRRGAAPEAVEAAAAAAADAGDGDAITEDKGGVPAHLLERSRKRKAALAGGGGGEAAPAAAGRWRQPRGNRGRRARADGHRSRRSHAAPADRRQVGLDPADRAEAQDKVHVWPHLLAIEFASILSLTAFVTVFSALVKAPLLGLADVNQTPNPSKAPWYFLGLQELLKMFHPMVAGVTHPRHRARSCSRSRRYIDKNPSNKPNDRKFAITMMTMFLMMWAVLVIIGSFFRGPGFNFIFPWNNGHLLRAVGVIR